jgi:catechol 2,3-dioxygenase-like lactoylglutathione lyase family enzyme
MDVTDQRGPRPQRGIIQRMDNIAIVVDDLESATAFFTALVLELEGEATVEGRCGGSPDRARGCPIGYRDDAHPG